MKALREAKYLELEKKIACAELSDRTTHGTEAAW